MHRLFCCLPLVAGALCSVAATAAAADELPLLLEGDTSAWDYQKFDDIAETDYAAVQADGAAATVLQATSRAGASGYTRRMEFALYDTPWLHFRWRVLATAANDAERTKAGDDFTWRLYFVGKSGLEYRVLNLVYAHSAAAGEGWKSPYAGFLRNIRTHALAAHDDASVGEWQTTAVNIGDLWRSTFDDDGTIGLVGLMTDGDNTGVTVQVQYGDIKLMKAQPTQ